MVRGGTQKRRYASGLGTSTGVPPDPLPGPCHLPGCQFRFDSHPEIGQIGQNVSLPLANRVVQR